MTGEALAIAARGPGEGEEEVPMMATVLIIVPVRMIVPMVIISEGMAAAATAAMPSTPAADRAA